MTMVQTITEGIDEQKIRSYLSLLSGSAGRLVISVAYFVAIANALSLENFGLFATASATGVVLSRLAGFGFISPLYRTATVRPRLIGAFTAGFGAAFIASLPLVLLVSLAFYWLVFSSGMGLAAFLFVMAAEILCWRLLEVVIIVNNGLGRFGTGAFLTIFGTAVRGIVAVGFVMWGDGSLLHWVMLYAGANAISFLFAAIFYYPKVKLRWKPRAYLGRMRDAFSVSAAEVLF